VRRVATIATTFGVALGIVTWLVATSWGEAAVAKGRELYPHRAIIEVIDKAARRRPAVVWIGDSTLMDLTSQGYPWILHDKHLAPLGAWSANLYAKGFDVFGYFTVMERVLDLGPQVVVLIAHLRLFAPAGGTRGFSDLAALLPAGELPRALTLPIAVRGLTAPRLLLVRLLATPWGERTFLMAEGARSNFQEAGFWSILGPTTVRGTRPRILFDIANAYTAPVTPGHPLLPFLGEAVRMATARGVRTLVVVTPIPWEWLNTRHRYDPAAVERSVGVLRRAVESNGGTLLDLHQALTTAELPDVGGHFNPAGREKMAALVWPAIARLLGVARTE